METAATRASPGEEKQPRKQRLSNERAIYRPPPARLILKETKEQNIDLGNKIVLSSFIWFQFVFTKKFPCKCRTAM